MKGKVKISIITVVFNAKDTIEQTIQSVLNQSYDEVEYIVIDGGSTDGTLDIIKNYQSRISYWISEPDSGIYNAMNKGIERATGEIIAFLNSGDWYERDIFWYIRDNFKDNTEILIGRVIRYGNNYIQKEQKRVSDQEDFRVKMIYCHQGIFVKRKLFEQYGKFNEKYKIAADYDWLLRMYYRGVSIKYTDKSFAHYRVGGVSSSGNLLANKEPKEIALAALQEFKEQNKIDIIEYEKLKSTITSYYQNILNTFYVKKILKEKLLGNKNLKDAIKNMFHSNYSIFGCGEVGKECLELLRQLEIQPECFWDNNQEKWGTFFEEIIIKNPEKIKKTDSVIIVASTYYQTEIKTQLENAGLEENVDFVLYTKIRNKVGSIAQKFL